MIKYIQLLVLKFSSFKVQQLLLLLLLLLMLLLMNMLLYPLTNLGT